MPGDYLKAKKSQHEKYWSYKNVTIDFVLEHRSDPTSRRQAVAYYMYRTVVTVYVCIAV